MLNICEDAPCCGCCGTNIYGQYQGDTGYEPEFEENPYDGWDEDEDEDDSFEGNEDAAMESGLFGDC